MWSGGGELPAVSGCVTVGTAKDEGPTSGLTSASSGPSAGDLTSSGSASSSAGLTSSSVGLTSSSVGLTPSSTGLTSASSGQASSSAGLASSSARLSSSSPGHQASASSDLASSPSPSSAQPSPGLRNPPPLLVISASLSSSNASDIKETSVGAGVSLVAWNSPGNQTPASTSSSLQCQQKELLLGMTSRKNGHSKLAPARWGIMKKEPEPIIIKVPKYPVEEKTGAFPRPTALVNPFPAELNLGGGGTPGTTGGVQLQTSIKDWLNRGKNDTPPPKEAIRTPLTIPKVFLRRPASSPPAPPPLPSRSTNRTSRISSTTNSHKALTPRKKALNTIVAQLVGKSQGHSSGNASSSQRPMISSSSETTSSPAGDPVSYTSTHRLSGGEVSISSSSSADPNVIDRLKRLGTVIEVEDQNEKDSLKLLEKMTKSVSTSTSINISTKKQQKSSKLTVKTQNSYQLTTPSEKPIVTLTNVPSDQLTIPQTRPLQEQPPDVTLFTQSSTHSSSISSTKNTGISLQSFDIKLIPPVNQNNTASSQNSTNDSLLVSLIPKVPFVTKIIKKTKSAPLATSSPIQKPLYISKDVTLYPKPLGDNFTDKIEPSLLEPVIDIVEEENNLDQNGLFIFKTETFHKIDLPTNEKVYTCDICSAVYSLENLLKKHYLRQHISRKYISEKDKEAFKIENDSNNIENYIFRCHICKECFPTKNDLKSHSTEHPPVEELNKKTNKIIQVYLKCENCLTDCKGRKQLIKHRRNCKVSPPRDKQELYHCLYCNETFLNGHAKRNHILSYHPYVRKKHTCVFCKKDDFQTNFSLFAHLLTEHPTLYFACQTCKERYTNLEELKEHIEKRHSSDEKLKSSLLDRVSTVNEEKIFYPCDSCQRKFLFENSFKEHVCFPEKEEKPKLQKIKKKTIPLSEKINRTVDVETLFFSRVSKNVRENLTRHMDGKIYDTELSDGEDNVSKNSSVSRTFLNFSDGFPSSSEVISDLNGSDAPARTKAPWEKYNFPKNYDGRCGLTSYIKDTAYLDISTQLIMRRNLQRLNMLPLKETVGLTDDGPAVPLDLDRLGAECAESFGLIKKDKTEEKSTMTGAASFSEASGGGAEEGEAGAEGELGGGGSASPSRLPPPLSGEWTRERMYVCSACSWESPCLWEMEDHKFLAHPRVHCPQHELIGDHVSLSQTVYKRLVESEKTPYEGPKPPPPVPVDQLACTKCTKTGFTGLPELHSHILECAGVLLDPNGPGGGGGSSGYGGGGGRKRRRRSRRGRARRGLKRNIPQTPQKVPPKQRTKPGDTDTIQRMIANLPAKRVSRKVLTTLDENKARLNAKKNAAQAKGAKNKNKSKEEEGSSSELPLSPMKDFDKLPPLDFRNLTLIMKQQDYIDTSAEGGDVLSSLRMMPVIRTPLPAALPNGSIESTTLVCRTPPRPKNTVEASTSPMESAPVSVVQTSSSAAEQHPEEEMPTLVIEKDLSPVESTEIPVLSPVESSDTTSENPQNQSPTSLKPLEKPQISIRKRKSPQNTDAPNKKKPRQAKKNSKTSQNTSDTTASDKNPEQISQLSGSSKKGRQSKKLYFSPVEMSSTSNENEPKKTTVQKKRGKKINTSSSNAVEDVPTSTDYTPKQSTESETNSENAKNCSILSEVKNDDCISKPKDPLIVKSKGTKNNSNVSLGNILSEPSSENDSVQNTVSSQNAEEEDIHVNKTVKRRVSKKSISKVLIFDTDNKVCEQLSESVLPPEQSASECSLPENTQPEDPPISKTVKRRGSKKSVTPVSSNQSDNQINEKTSDSALTSEQPTTESVPPGKRKGKRGSNKSANSSKTEDIPAEESASQTSQVCDSPLESVSEGQMTETKPSDATETPGGLNDKKNTDPRKSSDMNVEGQKHKSKSVLRRGRMSFRISRAVANQSIETVQDVKIEEISTDQKIVDPVSTDQKSVDPVSTDQKSVDPVSTDQKSVDPVSTDQKSVDPVSTDQKSVDPVSTDQKSVDPVSTDQKSVDPVSTDQKSFDPVSTDQESVGPVLTDLNIKLPKQKSKPVQRRGRMSFRIAREFVKPEIPTRLSTPETGLDVQMDENSTQDKIVDPASSSENVKKSVPVRRSGRMSFRFDRPSPSPETTNKSLDPSFETHQTDEETFLKPKITPLQVDAKNSEIDTKIQISDACKVPLPPKRKSKRLVGGTPDPEEIVESSQNKIIEDVKSSEDQTSIQIPPKSSVLPTENIAPKVNSDEAGSVEKACEIITDNADAEVANFQNSDVTNDISEASSEDGASPMKRKGKPKRRSENKVVDNDLDLPLSLEEPSGVNGDKSLDSDVVRDAENILDLVDTEGSNSWKRGPGRPRGARTRRFIQRQSEPRRSSRSTGSRDPLDALPPLPPFRRRSRRSTSSENILLHNLYDEITPCTEGEEEDNEIQKNDRPRRKPRTLKEPLIDTPQTTIIVQAEVHPVPLPKRKATDVQVLEESKSTPDVCDPIIKRMKDDSCNIHTDSIALESPDKQNVDISDQICGQEEIAQIKHLDSHPVSIENSSDSQEKPPTLSVVSMEQMDLPALDNLDEEPPKLSERPEDSIEIPPPPLLKESDLSDIDGETPKLSPDMPQLVRSQEVSSPVENHSKPQKTLLKTTLPKTEKPIKRFTVFQSKSSNNKDTSVTPSKIDLNLSKALDVYEFDDTEFEQTPSIPNRTSSPLNKSRESAGSPILPKRTGSPLCKNVEIVAKIDKTIALEPILPKKLSSEKSSDMSAKIENNVNKFENLDGGASDDIEIPSKKKKIEKKKVLKKSSKNCDNSDLILEEIESPIIEKSAENEVTKSCKKSKKDSSDAIDIKITKKENSDLSDGKKIKKIIKKKKILKKAVKVMKKRHESIGKKSSDEGKKVLNVAGFTWEVSEEEVIPTTVESNVNQLPDSSVEDPPPPPVKDEISEFDLDGDYNPYMWDNLLQPLKNETLLPAVNENPRSKSSLVNQNNPPSSGCGTTNTTFQPTGSSQPPSTWESSPALPVSGVPPVWVPPSSSDTSLGTIIDSVNKLLNEPEGSFSPLGLPNYSLADLQRAMGVSDAEMAVLTQLGEASLQLSNDNPSSSRGAVGGEEDWSSSEKNIIDLDSLRRQSSTGGAGSSGSSSVHQEEEERARQRGAARTEEEAAGRAAVGPGGQRGGGLLAAEPSSSSASRLGDGQEDERVLPGRRSSTESGPASLFQAHQGKVVSCPACNSHFIGFHAVQQHVARAHPSLDAEVKPRRRSSSTSVPKAELVRGRTLGSGPRLVCCVCQLILPADQMSHHFETEHPAELQSIDKCQTLSGEHIDEPATGERLRSKMSLKLGDLLNKAVSNLIQAKQQANNKLSGGAIDFLTKLCAVRQREGTSKHRLHGARELMLKLKPESVDPVEEPKVAKKLFSCGICGLKFSVPASRNKHEILAHRSYRPLVREINDYEDDWREAPSPPDSHEESSPLTINPQCSDCGLSFDTIQEMMRHRLEDHSTRRSSIETVITSGTACPSPVGSGGTDSELEQAGGGGGGPVAGTDSSSSSSGGTVLLGPTAGNHRSNSPATPAPAPLPPPPPASSTRSCEGSKRSHNTASNSGKGGGGGGRRLSHGLSLNGSELVRQRAEAALLELNRVNQRLKGKPDKTAPTPLSGASPSFNEDSL